MVIVFTREFSPSLPTLMTRLNTAITKHKDAKLHGAIVFLGEDDWLSDRRVLGLTKDAKETVLCLDASDGPPEYKIGKETAVTVLFCAKKTVRSRFEFERGKLTDAEVTKLLDELPKILPGK